MPAAKNTDNPKARSNKQNNIK